MIHAVYDVTHCTIPNPELAELIEAMRHTAHCLGCSVVGELPVLFQPHGATCVLVLAESHLTVSTWPEHHLAHIDLFTCRADINPEQAIVPILAILGGGTVHGQRIHRRGPNSAATGTDPAVIGVH
ncbi:S-adenosylmethionine decarboxylase [Streptoalloteichus hindustanus]|uniref:S-adenosylmethionine decarboxylase n=1 Tax=Streptoalloteichus hindustanus TaxID=2017 RepID=A0A1M5MRF6_STRHI|nr:S-adenosylmethionine decarboxylase [Streptoalloteichus hindustanus]SHG79786.1 S-adenosylmethionine decarboxylase [Streptoalloteichus hindustanus]